MALPQSLLVIDTPPTPIEERSPARHLAHSRSRQFLDTISHYRSRSRSSSASGAHSPTNVIAKMGLAAGAVAVEQIAPVTVDKEVIDGVETFLSSLHNMITRRETGLEEMVQEIKVDEIDDCRSIHSFHPILEAENNPFDPGLDETNTAGAERQSGEGERDRRMSIPLTLSMTREESFGEFSMDVLMYAKEGTEKVKCRARLDTGMTGNAVVLSLANNLGYPIQPYDGPDCLAGDGSTFRPLGQVTLPFHFASRQTAKSWRVEFLVFPDASPFDLCLGKVFISLAKLLKKSNPEALPVVFKTYDRKQERIKDFKTDRANQYSSTTKHQEDSRYADRRKSKPKEKDSKKKELENKDGAQAEFLDAEKEGEPGPEQKGKEKT